MDDVIIIGGSFAGLAAALQLGRARRKVTVLDTRLPRNRFAGHSHGLLGHDHKPPLDILAEARQQLARYPTISLVNARAEPVVFMLWGSYAQKKAAFVDTSRHLVLKAPHPSPLSAHSGFFGCKHFSKANAFLEIKGLAPIDWALPECAAAE